VTRLRWLLLPLLALTGCAWLDYPAVGIHRPVITGGQAQVDQGQVVDYDGLPGIWLAAHRSSHGSTFASLVDAEVGDEVCVYGSCYRVTQIIRWPSRTPPGYLGPLVLQTSLPTGVLLVVCEPV